MRSYDCVFIPKIVRRICDGFNSEHQMLDSQLYKGPCKIKLDETTVIIKDDEHVIFCRQWIKEKLKIW